MKLQLLKIVAVLLAALFVTILAVCLFKIGIELHK